MPFQPGVAANPTGKNGLGNKPFADALKRALAQAEVSGKGKALRDLADKLIEKAAEGDLMALKEIADRTDGKAIQTLASDPDAPFSMHITATDAKL